MSTLQASGVATMLKWVRLRRVDDHPEKGIEMFLYEPAVAEAIQRRGVVERAGLK